MNKLHMPRFQAELLSVERLDDEIYELRLTPPKGISAGDVFSFSAGQYCAMGFSPEHTDMRSYSIACAPDSDYLEFHIRHTGQGFSAAICDEKNIGQILHLTQAAGDVCFINDAARDIVMFAGGTGYAPMRAILQRLAAEDFNRRIDIFIGGRDLGALYMREELATYGEVLSGLRAYFCADVLGEASEDSVIQASLTALAAQHLDDNLADKRIYISGPPAMVIDIRDFALNNKADAELLHFDEDNLARFLGQNLKR